jgi:hypothetical protein
MLNQLVGCPMSIGRVEPAGPLESMYKKIGNTKFRTSLPQKNRSLPCPSESRHVRGLEYMKSEVAR